MYENFDNNDNNIKGTLKLFSEADINTIFISLKTSSEGIQNEEADYRLKEFGLNEISREKVKPWYTQLFLVFLNPFNFILGTLALVSLFTDVIFAKESERSWISIILIITMILISSIIKFIQEYRSSKTAEKLKNLIITRVTVIRDNLPLEIDIKNLVPGDIVKLTAGDIIPGDIRILSSKDLFISQSVLTGESNPVEKYPNLVFKTESISDLSNIVLMGTNVLSGAAVGVVLNTGKHTFLNTISESLQDTKSETSFEKGIDDVSKLLIKFMFFMVPIVFLINGFLKDAWFESLLFSLSVAIGLTPEMLPMIVTGNLTKGAIELSKKKTIVKKLDSIHNFGAMNILCTDKTGTLTQDKVTVVKYLNFKGDDDQDVLYLAYLNSFFKLDSKILWIEQF